MKKCLDKEHLMPGKKGEKILIQLVAHLHTIKDCQLRKTKKALVPYAQWYNK